MEYSININQKAAVENGLNIKHAALLDFFSKYALWCDHYMLDDKCYYFISRTSVLRELPLIFSDSDRVFRFYKQLHNAGFIEYRKYNKMDLIHVPFKTKQLFFLEYAKKGNTENSGKIPNNSENNNPALDSVNIGVGKDSENLNNLELGKNPEFTENKGIINPKIREKSRKNENSGKIPSKFGKNPEKDVCRAHSVNTGDSEKNSGKIPTYHIYHYTNISSLLKKEDLIFNDFRVNYPIVFEQIFTSTTFLEKLQISLKSDGIKYTNQQIAEIAILFIKNQYTAEQINATLKPRLVSYLKAVLKNGGLKQNNKPGSNDTERKTKLS